MKKIIFFYFLFPGVIFSQWIQQSLPSGINMILSIDFINVNSGIAGGWVDGFSGRAIYTTNSGTNWMLANVPDSSRAFVTSQLINSQTGYSSGAYNLNRNANKNFVTSSHSNISFTNPETFFENIGMDFKGDDYKGLFLKTSDGGFNWFTQNTLPSDVYYVTDMQFLNINLGIIIAERNFFGGIKTSIMKTLDGGFTWNDLITIDTVLLNSILILDSANLYAVGNDLPGGFIIKSTNGGSIWSKQSFPENAFSDIAFVNLNTGYAAGWNSKLNGIIFKTTNAGDNWFPLNIQSYRTPYLSIKLLNETSKGIITGVQVDTFGFILGTFISRTQDTGNTWTNYFINDPDNLLYNSSMINENVWFVCGGPTNPLIYKTTNGGLTFINNFEEIRKNNFYLYQNFPNPFNPKTIINYQLSMFSDVKLKVFDALGKEVTTLVNEKQNAGSYSVTFNGTNLSSGIYFYTLYSGKNSDTKKFLLIK